MLRAAANSTRLAPNGSRSRSRLFDRAANSLLDTALASCVEPLNYETETETWMIQCAVHSSKGSGWQAESPDRRQRLL